MGLVSPEAIQSVIEPGAAPAAAALQPTFGAPAIPGYGGVSIANNTPPVGGMAYPPPATNPASACGVQQPAAASASQDTDALMRAVMELPQAQIDMLPEVERQQIMALRMQFSSQRR